MAVFFLAGSPLLAAVPEVPPETPREIRAASLEDRLPAAVAAAQKAVEKARGVPFRAAVASALLPEKDLAKVLSRKLTEDLPVPFDDYAASLAAVGLLEPVPNLEKRLTNLYSRQVVGFYDPAEKRFYVVPERSAQASSSATGPETGPLVEEALLAHELTHALQDQRLDLDRRMKRLKENGDALLALEAFLEGEATVVMAEVLVARLPAESRDLLGNDFLAEVVSNLGAASSGAIEGADGVPELFVRELLFPYAAGTAWIRKIRSGNGWGPIDEVYKRLPETTAEILHPERRGTSRLRLSAADRPRAEELPTGASVLYADTLGEFALSFLLEQAGAGEGAQALAASWQDDRILFFRCPGAPAPVGFVWRLRCATAGDASRLAEALEPLYAGRPEGRRPAVEIRADLVDVSLGACGRCVTKPEGVGGPPAPR